MMLRFRIATLRGTMIIFCRINYISLNTQSLLKASAKTILAIRIMAFS
jgi:hypothetical protein